ncbi:hypothetical protein PG994_000931 [Apiospora phragmitis]|uniref:Uncharacterized protein n=1 Tax=Apiospora phragmitis TaxID=2905665 RepID=A0ABR1WRP0_9PEZI
MAAFLTRNMVISDPNGHIKKYMIIEGTKRGLPKEKILWQLRLHSMDGAIESAISHISDAD